VEDELHAATVVEETLGDDVVLEGTAPRAARPVTM